MTPLVAWPMRMMVSMPWALRMVSNALPENALVRCLAMTGSPSGRDRGVDQQGGVRRQHGSRGPHGAPQVVLGGNLGITGPEMSNAVGDENPRLSGRCQDLPGPLEGLPLVHEGFCAMFPAEKSAMSSAVVLLSSVISAIPHLPRALTIWGMCGVLRMP